MTTVALAPMLCEDARIDKLTSATHSFEGKWDGVRMIVDANQGVAMFSRRGHDVTGDFKKLAPQLADLLRDYPPVVLDGEAVALDDNGVPQFNAIQNHRRWPRVEFWAFDILFLDGCDLTRFPYRDRRRLLETFGELTDIVVPELIPCADGASAMTYSRDHGWEGVVAKQLDSTYDYGRRGETWLKDKHWLEREIVICGWYEGEGSRAGGIGSLLMGIPSDDGLQFIGRVGTGFKEADLRYLKEVLSPLETDESPFNTPIPDPEHRRSTYVEPILVGEVRYARQTADGRLVFPSWRGLRADKTIETIN